MKKFSNYLLILLLLLVLVLIRAFENELFYDPYLEFFKSDYLHLDAPELDVTKLTLFTALRYVLNSSISVVILYLFFKDSDVVKFAAIIYGFSFIPLILMFLYFVLNPKQENYVLFFNCRRFLIQPILLILLFPAFYYNNLKRES